ncbi:MAG: hypothetical protein ACOX6Y_12790 [Christensenellales bacterium]
MNQNTQRTPTNLVHGSKRSFYALFSFMLAMALLLSSLPLARAEQMAEYRDDVFSFQYPAAWKRRTAKDGSVILEVPGNAESGVQAFGITSNLLEMTGNPETDETTIRTLIDQHQSSGSKLRLSGEYDLLQYGALKGFRAPGIMAGRIKAQQVYLFDGAHMLVFRFLGEEAIKAEENILTSIVVQKAENPLALDGYVPFEREQYSLLYPEGYNTMEQSTGIAFLDKTKGNMILARVRTLDKDYDETLAPTLASTYLPKSTKVKAAPEMVQVGPWKAARITGKTESGPLSFYALGKGRTALLLLFLGQDALAHAEAVLSSVTIK